ncbi:MAG TPA: hypothetical protein VGG27_00715 [Magnetospirillaceae bacterium]|jgi:hypothetical protein
MGAFMRAKDWSKTPLGPVSMWSPALRMIVRFLLPNGFGALPLTSPVTPPSSAVVIPIRATKARRLPGLLVVDVGAYLKFKELYRSLLELVAAQSATASDLIERRRGAA